jgi:hypothetical protein
MSDPRLTEERLRHYLDGNQLMRERMCLALLAILGPYSDVRPRRPKGGPDGSRDIECRYQGNIVTWGAVGFRNGGGNDTEARTAAQKKFRDDLDNAVKENPGLQGFVFFTNVDLTPTQKDDLIAYGKSNNVREVDVFDMELLRNALDSPAGLLVREQYLDIPMTSERKPSVEFRGFTQVRANFGTLHKMQFRITGGDPGKCQCEIRIGDDTFYAKWDETPNPVEGDVLSGFRPEMVPATRQQRLYPDSDYMIPILISDGGSICIFDGWWFGRHRGYGKHDLLNEDTVVSIALKGTGLNWTREFCVRDIVGE